MNPVFRRFVIAVVGLSVLTGAVLVASSEDAVSSPELIAGGDLYTVGDGGSVKGTLSEFGAKMALGNNANAVLSLDLIADGGAGNRRDDGVITGAVSGRGTKIAIEVFATGVRTTLAGVRIKFDFDASLLSFVKAENSAFALSVPEGSVGVNLASTSPVTLASSGYLARAEFTTVADVAGREFAIGIESVTLAESSASQDELTTTSEISFNATSSPDFDGDGTVGFPDFLAFAGSFGSSRGDARYEAQFDLDGDGSVAFSDFLIFAGAFGSQVPPSRNGGGTTPPSGSPDLIVESPSVDDNTLTAGQSFTLRATVRNQGNASAASTTLRYYRSSDATVSIRDTEVGTDAVSNLPAGDTSAESIGLNAPSDAGTYYYGACVDGVSGENDTANNCSRGVMVTVARVSTGFAPADQNAFNSLAVGKRILAKSFFLEFKSAGRFTEGLDRDPGRYTYENMGANAGRLTQVYDDSELFGGRCTSELTFTTITTGTLQTNCENGYEGGEEAWHTTDLSAPLFVRAAPDTLIFAFLGTWRAGQTRAYDYQLRTKTPQGEWNDFCGEVENPTDKTLETYYIARFTSSGSFESGKAYEFRYRYRNSSSCDTGSPDPWSSIAEGIAVGGNSGGGGGGGGGTGNLGTCRSGLVVCPQGNCVHPDGTRFSVDASGRGRFGFITAGTGITIRSSNQTFVAEKRSDNCWIVREAR
ncbi:MAG: hypothetical protein OXR72_07265 [Gemmatimonadota bacterium]|nr:hypothetical protein [Gemmatimonadota bacterium]